MTTPTSFSLSVQLSKSIRAVSQLADQIELIKSSAVRLAGILAAGGRVLTAGNGGSAAEAQHLAAELVGRFRDEREPLSAIALCAESSTVTALVNDYGSAQMFSRQVVAHGRAGDALVAFSTSGRSENVIEAVRTARFKGMSTLALTGPVPNPLARAADSVIVIDEVSTPCVQEAHQVALHLLCVGIDAALADLETQNLESPNLESPNLESPNLESRRQSPKPVAVND